MAGGTNEGGDDELITQINVTPLVDVVLVLLIILMVTASYIVSRSIPMDLPQADGEASAEQPRTLTVSVDSTGQLFIDAEPVTDESFPERVRAYRAGLPNASDARAVISADGSISHSRFIRVIDMLRDQQVTHFAINVRPEDLH
jgi:biopolymer transport protein ExbD